MPDAKPPRGLFCPDTPGVRLTVVSIYYPRPGVKVRYLRCPVCGRRATTRETVVTTRPGKPG